MWSKGLTVISLVIFVSTLFVGEETAVVASGALALTCIVWYLKKAQAENVPKIQIQYYRETMKIRYKYNKKMMALQHEYGEDFEEDEAVEEMAENAYEDGAVRLQDASDDAGELVEEVTL